MSKSIEKSQNNSNNELHQWMAKLRHDLQSPVSMLNWYMAQDPLALSSKEVLAQSIFKLNIIFDRLSRLKSCVSDISDPEVIPAETDQKCSDVSQTASSINAQPHESTKKLDLMFNTSEGCFSMSPLGNILLIHDCISALLTCHKCILSKVTQTIMTAHSAAQAVEILSLQQTTIDIAIVGCSPESKVDGMTIVDHLKKYGVKKIHVV